MHFWSDPDNEVFPPSLIVIMINPTKPILTNKTPADIMAQFWPDFGPLDLKSFNKIV